jgi:hypothetical protein
MTEPLAPLARLLTASVALALILCVPGAHAAEPATPAAAPVDLTAALSSPTTLPGIAPDLYLTLTNKGDKTVNLPATAVLRVFPPDGEPFFAVAGGIRTTTALAMLDDNGVDLAPKQSRSVSILATPIPELPNWFEDERLNIPGLYRLQVALPAPPPYSGTIRSNEVTLTVAEPKDIDAAVWQQMLAGSPNARPASSIWRAVPPRLARDLLEKYPHSTYGPYLAYIPFLELAGTNKRALEQFPAIVAAYPGTAVANYLRLLLADEHSAKMNAAAHMVEPPDTATALRERQIARDAYSALVKDSPSPYIRARAAASLADVNSREDINLLEAGKPLH